MGSRGGGGRIPAGRGVLLLLFLEILQDLELTPESFHGGHDAVPEIWIWLWVRICGRSPKTGLRVVRRMLLLLRLRGERSGIDSPFFIAVVMVMVMVWIRIVPPVLRLRIVVMVDV